MRYLNVSIKDENYGIPLENVREVIGFPDISAVPGATQRFLGISSLRDQVLSIIDLRIIFGFVPTLTHDTSVVVCDFGGKLYGIVVDCIHSVISAEPNEIQSMGESEGEDLSFINCVVFRDNKLTVVLNVEKILKASDQEIKKALENNIKSVAA